MGSALSGISTFFDSLWHIVELPGLFIDDFVHLGIYIDEHPDWALATTAAGTVAGLYAISGVFGFALGLAGGLWGGYGLYNAYNESKSSSS